MSLIETRRNEPQGNNVREQRGETKSLLDITKNADTLAYVNGLFEQCKKNRQSFEKVWYMNMAFYFGKQWVQWTPTVQNLSRLYEPAAPSWRVRLVSNQIRPIIRTELAKATKEHPQAFVIPATSDDDDLAAAKAGESIFEHLEREMNLNRLRRRSMFWTFICGTGFIKDWYDPKEDQDGVPGAIKAEPVTPFHLYVPDLQEEEIENQPYLIHCLAKSADWVEEKFGIRVQADSNAGGGVLEQKFLNALGIESTPKQYVAVKEAWIKPCKRYPKGTVITWCNETLLSTEEVIGFPYNHNEYPFTKIDHIPTGRFYADSVINDLIPLQKELNRSISQVVEAKNRMAKPQLAAYKGSIDTNKITSEPGQIILVQPGYQYPQPIPLTPLPNYVLEQIIQLKLDMADLAGQHEISKGQVPPGVTAATAISYLQEADDTKLSPTITSLEEATERLGKHFLSHVQQFWELPRIIRVVGDEGQYESYEFTNSDIKGNTDLRIEAGSAAPRSKAGKQAFIMELGKMEWISPDRALKYLDMAETSRLYEEIQLDSRQQQRENHRIELGEEVVVNEYDNHEIHMIEINNFRKKQKFEKLPPEIKEIFNLHYEIHKQYLAASMGMVAQPGVPMPYGVAQSRSQAQMAQKDAQLALQSAPQQQMSQQQTQPTTQGEQ